MPSRLLLFTGAPDAKSLTWDNETGLLNSFEDRVARFAGIRSQSTDSQIDQLSSMLNIPYWRSLQLDRQHLPTGASQNTWDVKGDGAQFFAPSLLSTYTEELGITQGDQALSLESVDEVLSQFYDVSYAAHQDIPSSQIGAVSQTTTSFVTDSSYEGASQSFGSLQSPHQDILPYGSPLTNLKDLPNAIYLNSINPQTMTVNLIVGILSNPEPRFIRTRRGEPVRLVEVLVGDDTKSGFGINFWLSLTQDEGILRNLRPQDIVLIRSVALASFRGRVYGQSLRKDVTKVHLLYRKRLDNSDTRGCYRIADLEHEENGNSQLQKTQRVQNWVQQFIGEAPLRQTAGGKISKEILPPDTPSSQ